MFCFDWHVVQAQFDLVLRYHCACRLSWAFGLIYELAHHENTTANPTIGIYLHCLLAINGISLFIISNDLYKFIISLIGSIYIIYLGIMMVLPSTISTNNTKINNLAPRLAPSGPARIASPGPGKFMWSWAPD